MRPVIAVLLVAACSAHAPPARAPLAHRAPPPLEPVARTPTKTTAAWKPSGDVATSCRELFDEMEATYATAYDLDRLNIVDTLLADPPELPPEQLTWCGRELRAFARSKPPELEREAIDMLDSFADSAIYRASDDFVQDPYHKGEPLLCPSSSKVPSAIPTAGGTITSPDAEWNKDKGWECLRHGFGSPLHFQYEVRVDAAKQTLALYARRIDDKGQLIELVLRGHLDAKRHVIVDETIEGPGGPIPRHRRH